jgi:hypothetical protein
MDLDDLIKRLYKYELPTAIICILLPFILLAGNGGPLESISEFAYSEIDFIYVFLLTVAATLITTIGAKKDQTLTWLLGINLMLIPLIPHLAFPTIHLIVSIIFFGGMSFHILMYSDFLRKFRWFLVGTIALSFGLYFLTNIFTLFAVESIALVIFGINFLVDLIDDREDLDKWDVRF